MSCNYFKHVSIVSHFFVFLHLPPDPLAYLHTYTVYLSLSVCMSGKVIHKLCKKTVYFIRFSKTPNINLLGYYYLLAHARQNKR